MPPKETERLEALQDFLPTCSFCGKIRNEKDEWTSLQDYVQAEMTSQFSHGACPKCSVIHSSGAKAQGDEAC